MWARGNVVVRSSYSLLLLLQGYLIGLEAGDEAGILPPA